jgi:hypothetical protein
MSATSLRETSEVEILQLSFCTPGIFNTQVEFLVLTNKQIKRGKKWGEKVE